MSNADKLFEELGYEKRLCYYNSEIETETYFRDNKYASNIEFRHSGKMIRVYYGEKGSAGNIDKLILKAINTKVKELGWYEEKL